MKQKVKLEGGELVESLMGMLHTVKGKKHEQGGIEMTVGEVNDLPNNSILPEGSVVYSTRLKLPNEEGKLESMKERKLKRIDSEKELKNKIDKNIKALKVNPKDNLLSNSTNLLVENLNQLITQNEIEENQDVSFMNMKSALNNLKESPSEYGYGGKVRKKKEYAFGGNTGLIQNLDDLLDDSLKLGNPKLPAGSYKNPNTGRTYESDGTDLFTVVDGQRTKISPSSGTALKDYSFLEPLEISTNITSPTENPSFTPIDSSLEGFDVLGKPINEITDKGSDAFEDLVPFSNKNETSSTEEGLINLDNSVGDNLSLAGTALKVAPTLVTLFQGLTNTPNKNFYQDYGNKGLAELDAASQNIIAGAENANKEITLDTNTARENNRIGTRSLNTARSLDLATLNAAFKAKGNNIAQTYAQVADLNVRKAQALNERDRVVAEAAQKADENNRQDFAGITSALSQNLNSAGLALHEQADYYNNNLYNEDFIKLLPLLNEQGLGNVELAKLAELLKKQNNV